MQSQKISCFKNGISYYKKVNEILSEIAEKTGQKEDGKKKLQNNFNYMMQFFLFNLSIPKNNESFFSFFELLFITNVGNLNDRLDYSIKQKTNLLFLMMSEKKDDEVKDFKEESKKAIIKSKKYVLKIFDDFDKIFGEKSAYKKIIEVLANVIEEFFILEDKINDEKIIDSSVKSVKKFFFNIKN